MHHENITPAGQPLEQANKALIMLHGRGGNAADILTLAPHLAVPDFALLAPQATGNSWYPLSFLAKPADNEPWLSSALEMVTRTVQLIEAAGIEKKFIYLLGFSQGACLTLEFAARNADTYGGVVAFTGGLIGNRIDPLQYSGDFGNTPVFIGSSNPDPHVPVERVQATVNLLRQMNADVTEKIYSGMGHTINADEIRQANELVFSQP